jgi:hypothetical protein
MFSIWKQANATSSDTDSEDINEPFYSIALAIRDNRVDDFKQLLGDNDKIRKENALLKFSYLTNVQYGRYEEYTCVYELAVHYYQSEILEYLLQLGIDVNTTDSRGVHPLMNCLRKVCGGIMVGKQLKCLQLLISHPCINMNISCDRRTPLFYATELRTTDVLRMLLNHSDIDVNIGCTSPLMNAVENNYATHVRRIVVHKDVDVNMFHKCGDCAVHILPKKKQHTELSLSCVRQLLNHPHIDVFLMDAHGKTAIATAQRQEAHFIYALLMHERF